MSLPVPQEFSVQYISKRDYLALCHDGVVLDGPSWCYGPGVRVVLNPLPLSKGPALFECIRSVPYWHNIGPAALDAYKRYGLVVYRIV